MKNENPITPDIAKTILSINDRRILQAVKSGKLLTKAQQATLAARAHGDPRTMPATLPTIAALANALNLSRRTIGRMMHKPNAPRPEANGSHSVAAWLEFVRHYQPSEDDEQPTRKQKLANEIAELQIRKLRVEIGILEGAYLPITEVSKNVHDMITATRYVILRLPQLAHHLYGRDVAAIRATLEGEARNILETLSGHHWSVLAAQARAQDTAAAPAPVTEPPSVTPPAGTPATLPTATASAPAPPDAPPPASYEHPEAFELKEPAAVEADPTPAPTPATGAV